jgi:hypothetical protein
MITAEYFKGLLKRVKENVGEKKMQKDNGSETGRRVKETNN